MGCEKAITVTLSGVLAEHVSDVVGGDGVFSSEADFIRDLIRRDMESCPDSARAARAELREAFAAPESSYVRLSLDDVLHRNELTRPA